MSLVLVLGAGIVGSAAAWDLIRRGHEVTIADADNARSQAVAAEFDIASASVDVRDQAAVRRLLDSFAAVVSAVPYVYGFELAESAIATGTHFVDFGGNPAVVSRQRELHAAAGAAGVAVVPDCGLAPGLANVVAEGLLAENGGETDSVQIRVGALPQHPVGALGYQLAFSPHGLVNEYAEPCEVIEAGRYATVEPLTRFETVDWPRWGPLEAFSTSGGISTMAARCAGAVTSMEYKTLRYPGHGTAFRALLELGFFSEEPHDIDGVRLAPRTMLLDALSRHLPSGAPDVVLIRVRVDGSRGSVTMQCEDLPDGRFSALARTTAFPATAIVHLLLGGRLTVRGVSPMHEAVPAGLLLDELAAVSIAFSRSERVP